jgi:acyl-CoA thioester hydrolase
MDQLAGFPVVIELPVVWGEMDAYRHVNNTVYFRYFESARIEYFLRIRWMEFEQQTGIGPILASTSARFRKPLTWPDRVSVGASVTNIGDDRCTMEYLVVSHRLGAVAAEGQGIIVTYHYGEQKKAPFPEELRRRIGELQGG